MTAKCALFLKATIVDINVDQKLVLVILQKSSQTQWVKHTDCRHVQKLGEDFEPQVGEVVEVICSPMSNRTLTL